MLPAMARIVRFPPRARNQFEARPRQPDVTATLKADGHYRIIILRLPASSSLIPGTVLYLSIQPTINLSIWRLCPCRARNTPQPIQARLYQSTLYMPIRPTTVYFMTSTRICGTRLTDEPCTSLGHFYRLSTSTSSEHTTLSLRRSSSSWRSSPTRCAAVES